MNTDTEHQYGRPIRDGDRLSNPVLILVGFLHNPEHLDFFLCRGYISVNEGSIMGKSTHITNKVKCVNTMQ